MTRRRELPVEFLRVTTHSIEVLRRMRDQDVDIYYDNEGCVIMTDPPRKLSHKVVKSLRAQRFIRPRNNDPIQYVLTGRALELLNTDPRTKNREQTT